MDDLEHQATKARSSIDQAQSLEALEALRVAFFGRHGAVTTMLKSLGALGPDERKRRGAVVNGIKERISQALVTRRLALEKAELAHRLSSEQVDISLPGRNGERGGIHPVTRTLERIVALFERLGYQRVDGPEIEDDWHNFAALNFPLHHPARAMHDTFYIDGGRLLRTHTSPVQVRVMAARQPPIRIIAPGKVYRSDSDQTHSPMFHQVEGLLVDEIASFADLKGTLTQFIRVFFERDFQMRFRPSYFPFTEPSAEVDIRWEFRDGSSRWLEVLGCGMVHPHVLNHCGIDPERYTGFAFGLGVERFAMLRYGVTDLRAFFENDLRFLRQFA